MAIGYTGSDGNIQEFSYTPVDPQDEMMRQAFEQSQAAFNQPPPQPHGPTPYWENPATYYPRQQQIDPIEQAKAATAAAYKYIAFRGYQQDLKEGKSAADAFAKWGPMLVQDTSFGPAMKALTPPPAWRYNEQTKAYEGGGRPVFNPVQGQTQVIPPSGVNPGYIQDPKGGIHFFPKETASKTDSLTLADYNSVRKEFDAAIKASNNPDLTEAERTRASAAAKVAKARMENIRKSSGQTPSESLTPEPIKAVKEIIRLTRDGKKAVFDADTKQFIRYAE